MKIIKQNLLSKKISMQFNILKSSIFKFKSGFLRKKEKYIHLKNLLRPTFFMTVVLFCSTPLNAAIYYVSYSTGNDLN